MADSEAWMLSQGCFGTIWAAAGIFTLTAFFPTIFSVVRVEHVYFEGLFSRSEGRARKQRRLGFRPEAIAGDRPIARQDQASVWRKIVRLLSLSPPGGIKMRTRAGRPFWCPTLLVAGIVACLPLIGASSTSASGSSTSGKPSFYQIMFLVSVGAGVFAVILTFIFGCLGIWRGRGDDVRGVVKELTHPLGERLGGTYMTVKSVKVGKAKVKGITYDSRPSPAYGAVHEPSLVYEPSAASGSAYELSSV